MAMSPNDVMEDLAYSEAEGPADLWGEDEADIAGNGFEDYLEDEFEGMEDDYVGMEDEFEDEAGADDLLARMLGAEDEDEFLGNVLKGAKDVLAKAAPVIGKIARGVAPVLAAVPLPQAKIASQVANVLGKLRAEGASTEDALEAIAEYAARTNDPRPIPLVTGLAARSLVKDKGAAMSPSQRKQVVNFMQRATTTLIRRGGLKAIRALPRIAASVRRTAAESGTPVAARPQVVARTALKVAENPTTLRRLSTPSPKGQALVRGATNGTGYVGGVRTIRVPGPATIRIRLG